MAIVAVLTTIQTVQGSRLPHPDPDESQLAENVRFYVGNLSVYLSAFQDFILSILRANPSLRDTRSYLASFGPRPITAPPASPSEVPLPTLIPGLEPRKATAQIQAERLSPSPIVASILNPVVKRTALVKIQGPFTDVRLESIARGLVYLEKLGLVTVIVVDNEEIIQGDQIGRQPLVDEAMRMVSALERNGARARPVLGGVVRLGPGVVGKQPSSEYSFTAPEAHTTASDLTPIRSAIRAGEIPVIAPFAVDSFCRSVRIDANDVIGALACGMVEAAEHDRAASASQSSDSVDLTPLRLMIITREGGVPSYARSGYPHLLINMTSEYAHIHETFQEKWRHSNPTALSNLKLAQTCLAYMPPTSSAIMVSHRSPRSLIANLITNKPALSSSLPHALLQGNRQLTLDTPTILRKGLPVQVLRNVSDIDQEKMTALLEESFGRTLDRTRFYDRLSKQLDFAIVAGDYAGAAIVTNEGDTDSAKPISYLDKFAVRPSHQGDGTVDFLWVALHDESYGLGHPFSANPNGGRGGKGEGQDLVWRSRANNPVNKWYFERSSGHLRIGSWVLFWCDAEKHLKIEQGRRGSAGLSYVEDWEEGRLSSWASVVEKIPSSWT